MLKNKFLSIVIPVWKRPDQLELILNYFKKQVDTNADFEIILCDSKSGFEVDNVINKFLKETSNLEIKHLHCKLNSPAAKRNMGIDNASGTWIILLDDDCVPLDDFLCRYINAIEESANDKIVFLGLIEYKKLLVESENYYKYRQSRHIGPWRSDLNYLNLPFNNITTMNMCINRQAIIKNGVKFDEDYVFYGEDIDYGLQLKEKNFKLTLVLAGVCHLETTQSIDEYAKKLKGVPEGIARIEGKWGQSYREIFYSNTKIGLIRRVISFRLFSLIIFNKFFVNCIIYFLQKTNRFNFLYIPYLYHYVVYSRYCK